LVNRQVVELLGIELPIVAFSHCRDVVAAVTNAGGLGVLGAGTHSPEHLETELTWIDEQTKGRPYGVDLLLPAKYEGAAEGGYDRTAIRDHLPAGHVQFVAEMLRRYQVPDLPENADAVGRLDMSPVSPRGYEPLLDVAFAHPIRLIASALGPPPPSLLDRAKGNGAVVAALAGSVEHARRHVEAGAQLIVAQGSEAGGHTGEIGTMVLVPDVVDAVAPVPVLAAGGIASGRQMAAAMALGAAGVWCGSVWLTTREAETEPVVLQKMLAASSRDTIRSRSITGKPARMLRSAWTEEWNSQEAPPTLPVPLQSALIAEAQARINHAANSQDGAQKLANYFVGQVVGRLNRLTTCRQVVHEMISEYVEVAERFAADVTEE
jgi:NAD(P)H-dependent flavin oxidoreductase YrpB (nitropropane dioxygenase family)